MRPRRPPPIVAAVAALLTMATLALSAHLSTAVFLHAASAKPVPGIQPRGAVPAPAGNQTTTERNRAVVLRKVNSARVTHHLVPLRLDVALSTPAWKHSNKMMKAGTLFHTVNLTQLILNDTQGTCWGENIAMGPSLTSINQAWLNSAPHRANILNPRYRHAAIGVVVSGDTYWITFDFYG